MDLYEKWFAVVNPSSANGSTRDKWPIFRQKILKAGIEVEYAYTADKGNGIDLTRQAINRGYKKIIAVGGDGTVNEVVNGLLADDKSLAEGLELAIFAHGTGSDFVRVCHPRNNIDFFIDSLKGNRSLQSDVGKVTYKNDRGEKESRYFINAANLGIGAEVVNRVNNRSKALGSKLTYFAGTIATIFNNKNILVSLKLENKSLEGVFCGLILCNGQYIGGGMHIAPQAEIDDGLFDIIVIKDISKLKLFYRFPTIYQGKHIDLPEIALYRCQSVSLQTADSTILEADGEILGFSPSEFRILSRCLAIRI